LRSSDGGGRARRVAATAPDAEDGTRGADDAIESRGDDLIAVAIDLAGDVFGDPSLVTVGQRSLVTRRSVKRIAPILKLLASCTLVVVPNVSSTLPPPMSITTARPPPTSTP
jgi:hypothetical protein